MVEKVTTEELTTVALNKLRPNPYQPEGRRDVAEETREQFGKSILEHGLIMIPIARRVDGPGMYEIADGWLRLQGFHWLLEHGHTEYSELPVIVRALTDRQMADMVMEANTVRKDLNPIDLARLYKKYLEDFRITQSELASVHNCSQGEIANTIRLLELPEDIQGKIISREISETHGRQLLRMNYSPPLQQEVLGKTIKEGYSVNQLSNEVARTIYYKSENMDPNDYPKPDFDVQGCEKCPNRQKIGTPYSNDKKTWRCLDPECYKKKTEQAEKARLDKMAAEIAELKKDATGDEKSGVLDCTKLTWRDYQDISRGDKIDKPEECQTCSHRALGKLWNGRTEMVCLDVKCFKAKEKAYQGILAAAMKEEERKITARAKAACDSLADEATAFKLITTYLILHSRKDTREKFARMYGIPDPGSYFASGDEVDTIQKTVALVLSMERYEGEKNMFIKMLAELEGTSGEIEKQVAEFREKHCKTCKHDKGGCKTLIRVYTESRCYVYWKKDKDEPEEPGEEGTLVDLGDSHDETDGKCPAGVCRVCGCTEDNACETEQGPCHWIEPNLCSACFDKEKTIEEMEREFDESMDAMEKELDAVAEAECAEAEAQSEAQIIENSLPCKDCQNASTCDRRFFYTDGKDGYICDRKKTGAPIDFDIRLDSGETIRVTWEPYFQDHLEFRGRLISETGYYSDFSMTNRDSHGIPVEKTRTLEEVKEFAKSRAEELTATFAKVKKAAPKKTRKPSAKELADKHFAEQMEHDDTPSTTAAEEQGLLSFQFKCCDGCHWADQEKVGTGHPCCTFIVSPRIVDNVCFTRKVDNEANNPEE